MTYYEPQAARRKTDLMQGDLPQSYDKIEEEKVARVYESKGFAMFPTRQGQAGGDILIGGPDNDPTFDPIIGEVYTPSSPKDLNQLQFKIENKIVQLLKMYEVPNPGKTQIVRNVDLKRVICLDIRKIDSSISDLYKIIEKMKNEGTLVVDIHVIYETNIVDPELNPKPEIKIFRHPYSPKVESLILERFRNEPQLEGSSSRKIIQDKIPDNLEMRPIPVRELGLPGGSGYPSNAKVQRLCIAKGSESDEVNSINTQELGDSLLPIEDQPRTDMNVPRYEYVARQAIAGEALDASGPNSTYRFYNVGDLGYWPNERTEVHKVVANWFMEKFKTVPQNKKAVMLGGVPGAGKSTVIESLHGTQDNYVVLDIDEIRTRLIAELIARDMMPESSSRLEGEISPNELAAIFQWEAGSIRDLLEKEIVAQGQNIVFDMTMNNYDQTSELLTSLKQVGYQTTGIFVETEAKIARTRRRIRHRTAMLSEDGLGGRVVPPDYIVEVERKSRGVFEQLRNIGNGFDHSLVVDNSSTSPLLLNAQQGSKKIKRVKEFNQIDLTPAHDHIFVSEGLQGYIAPEPKPPYPVIKTPYIATILDIHVSRRAPNFVGTTNFTKPQITIQPKREPTKERYMVKIDHGLPQKNGNIVVSWESSGHARAPIPDAKPSPRNLTPETGIKVQEPVKGKRKLFQFAFTRSSAAITSGTSAPKRTEITSSRQQLPTPNAPSRVVSSQRLSNGPQRQTTPQAPLRRAAQGAPKAETRRDSRIATDQSSRSTIPGRNNVTSTKRTTQLPRTPLPTEVTTARPPTQQPRVSSSRSTAPSRLPEVTRPPKVAEASQAAPPLPNTQPTKPLPDAQTSLSVPTPPGYSEYSAFRKNWRY